MDITTMSHAERLALIRALAAVTHVCAIDGCDNEARHRCDGHAHGCLSDDDLEYGDADICDEHWGPGVHNKCLQCQPRQWYPRPKIGETITVRRPARYSGQPEASIEIEPIEPSGGVAIPGKDGLWYPTLEEAMANMTRSSPNPPDPPLNRDARELTMVNYTVALMV